MPDGVADILGQASERRVALTGWVGEHPLDGGDIAHLLLYPAGHGIAREMRRLADLLGLAPALAGPPTEVPPDTTRMTVEHGWARLHYGDTAWLRRPVNPEWSDAALARHVIMLTVGQDGWTGRTADLDRYLARGQRLHLGLIRASS